MEERFQILVSKYLDGTLDEKESSELATFVKTDQNLQRELAEAVLQASTISNVLQEELNVNEAVIQGAEIKPFRSSVKHRSQRFRPAPATQRMQMWVIAALLLIALAIPALIFRQSVLNEKQQQIPVNTASQVEEPYFSSTKMIGKITLERGAQKLALKAGQQLQVGDLISTDLGSYVTLVSKVGSTISLNEKTSLKIDEDQIQLIQGELYAKINKNDAKAVYHYNSPIQDQIEITGTVFEWSYSSLFKNAILKVEEGLVRFKHKEQVKSVTELQMLTSNDFSKGVKEVLKEDIAPWLEIQKYFKNNRFFYKDNFKTKQWSDFWTLKKDGKIIHKQQLVANGITCQGENQEVRLVSIKLPPGDATRPLKVFFKTLKIYGQGEFEISYRILTNQPTPINTYEMFVIEQKNKTYLQQSSKPEEKSFVAKAIFPIDFTFDSFPLISASDETGEFVEVKPSAQSPTEISYIQFEFILKTKTKESQATWLLDSFRAEY